MKILDAEQIRAADQYTIASEPVSSIDLMERAAAACARRLAELAGAGQKFIVFCGMGNNGGDGLAISRMLLQNNFPCTTVIVHFRDKFSPDAQANLDRLKTIKGAAIIDVTGEEHLPVNDEPSAIAVDALLGTGVNKNSNALLERTIDLINKRYHTIVSIDIPSGLLPDGSGVNGTVVQSTHTLTFHAPKLAFLLPGNARWVPSFEVLDIRLREDPSDSNSSNYFVTAPDIRSLLRPRHKFSHKGTYGHALLLAGSKGKSGAALMAAESCLRAGAGLLTLHSNRDTIQALQVRHPEAMSIADDHPEMITHVEKPEGYAAVGFGPGVGQGDDTARALKKILQHGTAKLVIDADGLNILAANKTWLEFLPPGTILTPHPKEFERLVGKQDDDTKRHNALKQFSIRHNSIVVLKGAHTCVAMPDGNLFFNSSGNPGLAKGGTGDVLTGIILGLLASGYNAPQSALIGVFIHGLAADLCAKRSGLESILATDVIAMIGSAFKELH